MTTVTAVAGTTAGTTASTSSTDSTDASSLNADTFLKLLVTQLKNQDPSSPMDTNQMLSQMTALASMEQLTTMSSSTSSSYALQQRTTAASMIGKVVDYTGTDGTAQSGLVSSVGYAGTTPTLTVGEDTVALSSVTGVSQAA